MIAIYARVSTEEQAKHGFSLKDQLRACREKAKTKDIREYVDEGVSGEFLDRPQLSRLRGDIRAGLIHQVICLDPDRLSRKLMNQLILSDEIEARAELVFVNGEYARTPEGQLFYQMRGAISQFEKAKISERMSRGRREKARQGRVLRDFHIYGYDFDRETEQFIVNPREATIVRRVFDMFTHPEGHVQGINGIARHLTDLGIPTKRGASVFHRQVVRQMLMNRAYIGEFYQNKWNTEGMLGNRYKRAEDRIRQRARPLEEWIRLPIPRIIEDEQFHYAQSLLEASRRRWAGHSKHLYLLSGLLRCGECGNTLTGRKGASWGKEVYYYTDLKLTVGAKHPGCGLQIPCETFDRQVWETILSWVKDPDEDTISEIEQVPGISIEESELQHINEEIQRVDCQATKLLDLLSDPAVEAHDIRIKLKDVQDHRRKLTAKKQEVLENLRNSHQMNAIDAVGHRGAHLREAWETMGVRDVEDFDPSIIQNLIRTIVKEIHIFEQGARIEIFTL